MTTRRLALRRTTSGERYAWGRMRIAVTGGSGKLGRAVVDELLAHDHQVANLDRVPSPDTRATFTRVDFTDFGQTTGALSRVDDRYDHLDAVVHLAAIP